MLKVFTIYVADAFVERDEHKSLDTTEDYNCEELKRVTNSTNHVAIEEQSHLATEANSSLLVSQREPPGQDSCHLLSLMFAHVHVIIQFPLALVRENLNCHVRVKHFAGLSCNHAHLVCGVSML